MSDAGELSQFNMAVHKAKGLGVWRALYLDFLEQLNVKSILDVGSGSPDFLSRVDIVRKHAIDGGSKYQQAFEEAGVNFHVLDLDKGEYPALEPFEAIICSDVFEHLIFPLKTLEFIHSSMQKEGVFISHVPNEFTWKKTVQVMLGKSDSMYFHKDCDEYEDPHVRRFTKIGFERFLEKHFKYNLFISDMRYKKSARRFQALGLTVPYALEGGPTFISTNSEARFAQLKDIKNQLSS